VSALYQGTPLLSFLLFCLITLCLPSVGRGQTQIRANQLKSSDSYQFSSINGVIYVDGNTYACTASGLQAAITAAGSKGTVDARGCTGPTTSITDSTGPIVIGTNGSQVTVNLGPGKWTCTITTVVTAGQSGCWNLVSSGAKLIGAGSGPIGIGDDPGATDANGVTNFVCSSCGEDVDMIRVAIPNRGRSSLGASILANAEVSGIWINMGNSGRDPVYATSVHWSNFHDIQGYLFSGNGFHLEGDMASPNHNAESYQNTVERVVMQPPNSNSTGAACYLDASHGEIAWSRFATLRCSGNITNGGGMAALYLRAGISSNQSIDNLIFTNSYFANPKNTASSWGVRMEAPGTFATQSGGRIFQIQFVGVLTERLVGPSAGTAMGCTTGGSASGTGCGAITRISSAYTSNWVTGLDRSNMGQNFADIADASTPGAGNNTYRTGGVTVGANSGSFFDGSQHNASGNSQALQGYFTGGSCLDNGFTSLSCFAGNWQPPSLASAGTGTNFSQVGTHRITGQPSFGSFRYGFLFDNGATMAATEGRAPTNGTKPGYDVIYSDSTAHAWKTSINNGNFHRIFHGEQGSCAMSSSATCTFSVSAGFSSAPLCFVTIDQASALPRVAISAKCAIAGTTVSITAGASNSLIWDAVLLGDPN
jgi:hypothetical protein